MKSNLELKGLDGYLATLVEMGKDIDPIAEEALDSGAPVLYEGMEKRAPELTGHLKGKIQILNVSDGNYHARKVGVYAVNRETEMYFFYQENGSPRNPAHPYIRPTFDYDWKTARAKIIAVLKAYGAAQ